jgi:integrase
MRASEALAVTPAGIEQKNGIITITSAKGGKERRVLLKKRLWRSSFPTWHKTA